MVEETTPAVRRTPGSVRDAILEHLYSKRSHEADIDEIWAAVNTALSDEVPRSSVRSYLNLNTAPKGSRKFERTGRGQYKLMPR